MEASTPSASKWIYYNEGPPWELPGGTSVEVTSVSFHKSFRAKVSSFNGFRYTYLDNTKRSHNTGRSWNIPLLRLLSVNLASKPPPRECTGAFNETLARAYNAASREVQASVDASCLEAFRSTAAETSNKLRSLTRAFICCHVLPTSTYVYFLRWTSTCLHFLSLASTCLQFILQSLTAFVTHFTGEMTTAWTFNVINL